MKLVVMWWKEISPIEIVVDGLWSNDLALFDDRCMFVSSDLLVFLIFVVYLCFFACFLFKNVTFHQSLLNVASFSLA